MRKRLATGGLVVLALALLVALAVYAFRGDVPDLVGWMSDYEQALEESKRTGKPVLMDFGFEGCGACRYMDTRVFGKEAIAAMVREGYVPLKIDMLDGSEQTIKVLRQYHIYAAPTFVMADGQGREIDRKVGLVRDAKMRAWLQARSEPHG